MSSALHDHLAALERELEGHPAEAVQARLQEAEARIQELRAQLAWEAPGLCGAELEAAILARLPAGGASQPAPPPSAPAAWPSCFGILADPMAYLRLVYLLLRLPFGILHAVWLPLAFSLSLGLMPLLVGFPLLALSLGAVRGAALLEARLAEALLGSGLPHSHALMPPGPGWTHRLANLFRDPFTWKGLLYLALQPLLGAAYAGLLCAALVLGFTLLALPVLAHLEGGALLLGGEPSVPMATWQLLLAAALGALAIPGSLHLAHGLARLHGSLASALLGGRFSPRR